jgi:hypothetical protein
VTTHLDHEQRVGVMTTKHGDLLTVTLERKVELVEDLAKIHTRTLSGIKLYQRVGQVTTVAPMSRANLRELLAVLNRAIAMTEGEVES